MLCSVFDLCHVELLVLHEITIFFHAEFTTMAGRRLRDAVKTVLSSQGKKEFESGVHVVIAGLTNAYSQYVTTFEEYQIQRYEVGFSSYLLLAWVMIAYSAFLDKDKISLCFLMLD